MTEEQKIRAEALKLAIKAQEGRSLNSAEAERLAEAEAARLADKFQNYIRTGNMNGYQYR